MLDGGALGAVSSVRRENAASAIAKHGAAKLPAVLPEVPPREHNKRTKLQNIISAGRKEDFPLFCPKCRQERIINARNFQIEIIDQPDAKTQC